jgi:hypothetical protein
VGCGDSRWWGGSGLGDPRRRKPKPPIGCARRPRRRSSRSPFVVHPLPDLRASRAHRKSTEVHELERLDGSTGNMLNTDWCQASAITVSDSGLRPTLHRDQRSTPSRCSNTPDQLWRVPHWPHRRSLAAAMVACPPDLDTMPLSHPSLPYASSPSRARTVPCQPPFGTYAPSRTALILLGRGQKRKGDKGGAAACQLAVSVTSLLDRRVRSRCAMNTEVYRTMGEQFVACPLRHSVPMCRREH